MKKKTIKISLRLVLIIPSILLIFSTVALVGYLSYVNGKKAVSKLAHQLMEQSANRISDNINNAITLQQTIVGNNADLVKQNLLNINDYESVSQYLWQQIKASPNLANTMYINKDKYALGYIRLRSQAGVDEINKFSGKNDVEIGTLILEKIQFDQPPKSQYYLVDNKGEKRNFLYKVPINKNDYIFPALKAKKQGWLPILLYQPRKVPELNAVSPVYNSNSQIEGVFLSSRLLAGISKFLEDLSISPSGQSFILEKSSDLVATSKRENLYLEDSQGNLARLSAMESQNPWIRAISLE